ncbi:OsmC family protein, partial [Candidatus Phytoplasma phoenicium]|uniref:OsmC family protein n=1 Tax=Candidatus Phytoplasma phoenicium TaxID=198422 RepID=UPI00067BD26E
MSLLKIMAYHENKFNDIGIVKNGLKTKLTSALMNEPNNYTPPNELFCLSLVICFYKTMKKYLSIKNNIFNDVSVQVLCQNCKDTQGFYFKIELLCGIANFSLEETHEIINLVHQKCPVSRMLNHYPHITLTPIAYT